MDDGHVTRIAPSPTGALHLGNARTFLVNWATARQLGWKIVLRIDDLDGPRIKAGADADTIDTMRWLGIDWDQGPVYESHQIDQYDQALSILAAQGAIYPCGCTRTQIAAASLSAPHADQHELRYPGTCRPLQITPVRFEDLKDSGVAWRLRVPDEPLEFTDQFAGVHKSNIQQRIGDILVTNKQGIASYQLACVIDDGLIKVTDVIRGDDLLTSTLRQMILQKLLGLPQCRYWHLPLVVGEDGRRLAKRHGDTTINHYRENGVTANRIRGLIAYWCGSSELSEYSAKRFCDEITVERLPSNPIVFTPEHDRWLRQT